MKMEPRNLSAFLPLVFAKLSLFHNPQNLPCPPRFLLSFYLFSFWPLPFVSMCHSSEAFSSHSRLLIFQFSGYHNSLLCLEQIIPTTITCSFLPLFWAQRLPAWKAPFFWCSWEVAATIGGGGARSTYKNANSAPEDKKRRFYGQLQRHLHSLLCKS